MMVKRIFMIGLLAVSLVAVAGKEAFARVCVGYIGSYCIKWSGSVECQIGATGVGNVTKTPTYLGCTVSTDGTGTTQWVVGCGNPGSNAMLAPGTNTVFFEGEITGTVQLTPEQVTQNGQAVATAYARPDQELLDSIFSANPGICPNPNWTVKDAVPCKMMVRDVQVEVIDGQTTCITGEALHDCTLANCETLAVDSVTKTFERRQYSCDQVSSITYNKTNYICW